MRFFSGSLLTVTALFDYSWIMYLFAFYLYVQVCFFSHTINDSKALVCEYSLRDNLSRARAAKTSFASLNMI